MHARAFEGSPMALVHVHATFGDIRDKPDCLCDFFVFLMQFSCRIKALYNIRRLSHESSHAGLPENAEKVWHFKQFVSF